MLHSIPPANRRRGPGALSSMRSATLNGHVFVGSHIGSIRPTPIQERRSKVVLPVTAHQREQMRYGLRELAMQIEQMIIGAEDVMEIAFWQKALARLRGE